MPSYRGQAVFGRACTMIRTPAERAGQAVAYPGVDGVEHIDHGERGGVTVAEGRFFADTSADLEACFGIMESLSDGQIGVLVNTNDVPYINVLMGKPERVGRVTVDANGWTQRYRVTMTHLT